MANVQPENGCLRIAHDLVSAMLREPLSALELKVLIAVMELTYGSDRTKSQISSVDIRYMLGADSNVRTDRIEQTIDQLIAKQLLFKQTVNQSTDLLGIQKDFEKWEAQTEKSDKMSSLINKGINNTSNTRADKLSPLIEYAHRNTDFRIGIGALNAERKAARLLYTEALQLSRSPLDAAVAIKDYIDELNTQEWFAGCKMRCVYMSSRFKQWYKSRPAKPKAIKEQEQDTGYKFIYNTSAKDWRMSDAKL